MWKLFRDWFSKSQFIANDRHSNEHSRSMSYWKIHISSFHFVRKYFREEPKLAQSNMALIFIVIELCEIYFSSMPQFVWMFMYAYLWWTTHISLIVQLMLSFLSRHSQTTSSSLQKNYWIQNCKSLDNRSQRQRYTKNHS
jgi:hypothetical protein